MTQAQFLHLASEYVIQAGVLVLADHVRVRAHPGHRPIALRDRVEDSATGGSAEGCHG
jgi:hypothetical protein